MLKRTKMMPKWMPKSMNVHTFSEKVAKKCRRDVPRGAMAPESGTILEAIFDPNSKKAMPKEPKGSPKSEKGAVKHLCKKRCRTNNTNMPKGYQNDAQMDAKIDDFSYFFEKDLNARNYLFYNRKRGSEQVKIKKKSIQNRRKIKARTNDAERSKNKPKGSQNGYQNL